MNGRLVFDILKVTEAAALAASNYLGRGDKNEVDDAAVKAMRKTLNEMDISGEIVIGEGEIDEAPMLYIGEQVGCGTDKIDIAVDPIEGTRMVAMGQNNALATIAFAEKDSLFHAPDMYMEKLIVGSKGKEAIDLSLPFEENIVRVAKALGKKVEDLTIVTLAKPRHDNIVKCLQKMGAKVYSIPDGDVAASILTCDASNEIDLMYTIGGAPEGVLSACAVKALGGDMNARLVKRTIAKGSSEENIKLECVELSRCKKMNVDIEKIYTLDELVKSDKVIFSATGITKGDLLEGIKKIGNEMLTETLVIDGINNKKYLVNTTHKISDE